MERYQQHYRALGSEVLLTLVTDKKLTYANQLFDGLRQQIADFEQQFSRFLPDSELSQFNQRAGQKTPVSPAFRALLVVAQTLSKQTEGLYNPFVLPALQKAGYLGSWPRPNTDTAGLNFTGRKLASVQKLVIGDTWARIPKSAAVDFGGIGKGYLLDQLAQALDSEALSGYWLSLGGDIICAGHDIDSQPWQVAVQSAVAPDKTVEILANQANVKLAIATSGTTKRQGLKSGKPWHHLIDPRTGQPADTTVLTTTVSADRAVIADVYAKCIIIDGPKLAKRYQAAGIIQSYILQMTDQTTTIEILEA